MPDPHSVKWHDISDVARFLEHVNLLNDSGNRHIDGHEYGYRHIEANGFTTGINGTHTGVFTMSLVDNEGDTKNDMYSVPLQRISQRVYELAASLPPPRAIVITTTPSDATFRMYGGRYVSNK